MILNVYKPKSWTSFDVVAKVRSILRQKRSAKKVKVGHAGTLDPLAEGVLIVLTDEDTKKQSEFMKMPKEYLAKIAFGATSPTYDLEGALVFASSMPDLKELKQKLWVATNNYIGKIVQQVPPYSAVKVKGSPLYKISRQTETLPTQKHEIPVKRIEIYDIDLVNFGIEQVTSDTGVTKELPVVTLKVGCSSGTYIRSLAHDLGENMKTGGVLVYLKRERIGEYLAQNAIPIEKLSLYLH